MNQEWKCTDPNNNQYGRLVGTRIYEFKQDMKYPDGSIVEEEMTIDLDLIQPKDIVSCLSAFGYVEEEMKNKGYSESDIEWLKAECYFECNVS